MILFYRIRGKYYAWAYVGVREAKAADFSSYEEPGIRHHVGCRTLSKIWQMLQS
jgi:hypothetical protein